MFVATLMYRCYLTYTFSPSGKIPDVKDLLKISDNGFAKAYLACLITTELKASKPGPYHDNTYFPMLRS